MLLLGVLLYTQDDCFTWLLPGDDLPTGASPLAPALYIKAGQYHLTDDHQEFLDAIGLNGAVWGSGALTIGEALTIVLNFFEESDDEVRRCHQSVLCPNLFCFLPLVQQLKISIGCRRRIDSHSTYMANYLIQAFQL